MTRTHPTTVMAARDMAGLRASLRPAAASAVRYAAGALARLRGLAAIALRPAMKAWLRPSLHRRLALTIGVVSVGYCLVLMLIGDTVSAMTAQSYPGYCYGSSHGPYSIYIPGPDGCSSMTAGITTGAIVICLVLLMVSWLLWLLAGWALAPLKATAETVRRLGPQNLGQRIGLASGDDQFKALADAIDDALDRLAAGYESQRRFAANASHELRTPLAVQRLLTEVAMDDPDAGQDLRRLGTQLLRTNEHNEQLVEGMLTLAESDRGLQGKVPFRLDALAGRVIDQHEEQAARHQLTLRRALAAATISGDPVLLERLLVNLIENAIKYNEPGGWVEIEVTQGQGGLGGTLAVRNTGAPVPAEAVPVLFEPFRRLGGDRVRGRGGVGLGLAIARSIVAAHHADLQARPRPDGGLEIVIGLPG